MAMSTGFIRMRIVDPVEAMSLIPDLDGVREVLLWNRHGTM